ncbi:MAG: glycosyltransferase family 1 protein [Sphingomonadales bacterium]|nr:glycosyltransferase family 1 protein [Sphingomonadales bacterium]
MGRSPRPPSTRSRTPSSSSPNSRSWWPKKRASAASTASCAAISTHIATEGPLGFTARRWCLREGLQFTTAYHTHFPDYVARRTGVRPEWIWKLMRHFHARSSGVMTTTETMRALLRSHGITNLRHWGRGVDLDAFSPDKPAPALYASLTRPIQLYVGRVAVEKNIEGFLKTGHPGSKVVVGDGPARGELEQTYPEAHFIGMLSGDALAGAYAGADVFVFPSRTDTFGLVIIEALASGTPVAAYPVAGPIDICTDRVACLDDDLDRAIAQALTRRPEDCLALARHYSWRRSAEQFLDALVDSAEDAPLAA